MTMVKSWGGYDILIHKLAVAPCTIVGVKWAIMHFIQDDCPIHLHVIQVLNELGKDSQNRLYTFFLEKWHFQSLKLLPRHFYKVEEVGLTLYSPLFNIFAKHALSFYSISYLINCLTPFLNNLWKPKQETTRTEDTYSPFFLYICNINCYCCIPRWPRP